jgi:hypothetical protein
MAQLLATGGRGLDALQTCVDSEEHRRAVDAGLAVIRGTNGLHPRRNALDEMTSNPRLLSQQSREERERFAELLYYFDVLQATADFAESSPEESGMEMNPILHVGPAYEFTAQYFGFDWKAKLRRLSLGVPVDVACRDDALVKAFFNWERRQAGLPVISRKWRGELEATRAMLEARR